MIETKDTYVTNDLSFAAYLRMNNIKMLKAQKLGRTYQFVFEKVACIDALKIGYIHSESSRFDDEVRKLKKILFSES